MVILDGIIAESSARTDELRELASSAADAPTRVRALSALALHLDLMNLTVDALDVATDAVTLAVAENDPGLVGWAHLRRMLTLCNGGRFEDAVDDGRRSYDAFVRAGDAVGRLRAASALAETLLRLDRFDDGFRMLTEAAMLLDAIDVDAGRDVAGDTVDIGVEVMNATILLADAYCAISAFDDAVDVNERAVAMAGALRDPDEVMWAQYRLAHVLVEFADSVEMIDRAKAIALYRRAGAVLTDMDPAAEARAELGVRSLVLLFRGVVETATGSPQHGIELLDAARRIGASIDQSPLEYARCYRGLGRAHRAIGDLDRARTHLDEALRAFDRTDSHTEIVGTLGERAAVAAQLGDHESAVADLRRALLIREMQRERETSSRADSVSARIDVERGRAELRQRERAADDLRRMAGEDPLTGIANRRTLDTEGAALVAAGGEAPVSIAVIDIDDFKAINDRHSHLVGDSVLRKIAEILAAHVRSVDLVARYAGDEFVLVLPDTDAAAAAAIHDRVQAAIADERWSLIAPGLGVSVSCGLATGTGEGGLWALFGAADAELYGAKRRLRAVAGAAPR